MELSVVDDAPTLAQVASSYVLEWVGMLQPHRPRVTVVAAAASVPLGMYRHLATQPLDVSALQVFQLDAWLGVGPQDRRSRHLWLRQTLLDPLGIPDHQVVRLPGDSPDPQQACIEYDLAVNGYGGIDIAILGLGPNGEVGFNEPLCPPDAPTRVVDLSDACVEAYARCWGGRSEVPVQGMTAGMRTLLGARHVLLLVSGAEMHPALHATVKGPVGPEVPATWFHHADDAVVLCDRAAWEGDG